MELFIVVDEQLTVGEVDEGQLGVEGLEKLGGCMGFPHVRMHQLVMGLTLKSGGGLGMCNALVMLSRRRNFNKISPEAEKKIFRKKSSSSSSSSTLYSPGHFASHRFSPSAQVSRNVQGRFTCCASPRLRLYKIKRKKSHLHTFLKY